MARPPRLEFEGAIYHVINRGNYRKDLFGEKGAAEAFERALFEACEKCGWIVHAYVLMSNHYHLALETPEANLVRGMAWLQGTFANRFNRFHGERGHVFQSRYQSILIEEGRPLLGLVDYIHLNPVRAGLLALPDLGHHSFSSYPKFFRKHPPDGLCRARFLASLEFPDSVRGMRKYAQHLETVEERDPARHDELTRRYCTGWAVASAEYRRGIKKQFAAVSGKAGWPGGAIRELREAKWERELAALLRKARKSRQEIGAAAKSAEWKVRIAREMKRRTTATNPWLAEELNMGHPSRVCNLINDI
jgi:putative transposase